MHKPPTLTALTALVALASLAGPALADTVPGFRTLAIPAPHHGHPLEAAVWYPAGAGGTPERVGGNPVFIGRDVARGAEVAAGRHPVVVLSHGLGGHYRSLGWLAAELAMAGAVVVGVNHPGSTTRDMDPQRGLAHWTRAQDVSAVLDHLLAAPDWAGVVDGGRVGVVGFSYGGWTALSLAGVTGNLDGYAGHCKAVGDASSHCSDIARWGADLRAFSAADWNASRRDERVGAVVALDPGLTWGLGAGDVAGVRARVHLIGFGSGADRLLATDFSAAGSGFGAFLPADSQSLIAPAYHFSLLPICTPKGAAILKDEGDDPVCTDPPGADRAAIHAQVVAQVRKVLWP